MKETKLRVVIIDDNVDNMPSFLAIIEDALPGTEVYTASNGLQGINLARSTEPDVILIDIHMTEDYGKEASQIMMMDKALQMTPILFITDLETDRHLRIKALEVGAEAFLFKPLEKTILVTQLKAMAKIKERNVLISANNERLETLVKNRTRELKQETIERKNSEKDLLVSKKKFETYIEAAPIGIFVIDSFGRYIDVNDKACQLTGYTKKELLLLSIFDYLSPEYAEKGLECLNEIKAKGITEGEYKARKKDGEEYWISVNGAKINDNCSIAFCNNITERKERELRIEYLSYHDTLTQVYNRAFYEEEIKRLDTEDQLPVSIIISDFNGLKLINDTLGHVAGDIMLVETVKILSKFTRKNDILARVGGDEFSILLPRTCNTEAQLICDRIATSCKQYKVDVLDHNLAMRLSVGHATKTTIHESFSYITKIAEDYMYRLKLLERDSYHSSLLSSLKTTLFERSHETQAHATRLVALSTELGIAMKLNEKQLKDLELLSALHDIGKISIDNSILIKPGKLTDDEWLEMKKHPAIGYRIALASPDLKSIADYILGHHERWDGKGYPQGLSGERIPLLARIISVIDAYDAMSEDRPYRKALTKKLALAEIAKNSGTQFDPEIATLFIETMRIADKHEN